MVVAAAGAVVVVVVVLVSTYLVMATQNIALEKELSF